MSIKFRKCIAEYLERCRERYRVLCVGASILFMIIVRNMRMSAVMWEAEMVSYSVADYLVALQKTQIFGFYTAPILVILFQLLFRQEYNACLILRRESRRKIWGIRAFMAVCFAAMASVWHQLTAVMVGGLTTESFINWSDYGSLYFIQTEKHLNDVTFGAVLAVTTSALLLKIAALCLITLTVESVAKRKELAPGLVLLAAGSEYYLRNIPAPIFFEMISVSYLRWTKYEKIAIGITYGVTLIVILWGIGHRLEERRDYL